MYDHTTKHSKTIKYNKAIPIVIFIVSLYPLYYFISVEIPKFKRSKFESFLPYLLDDFAGRMLLPILFIGALIYLIYGLTRKNKIIERIYNFKFYKKDDDLHCTIKMEEFETTKDGRQQSDEKTTEKLLISNVSKVKEINERKVSYSGKSTRTGMNLNHISGKKDFNFDNPVGVYTTKTSGSYMQKEAIYEDGTKKDIFSSVPLEELKKHI